MPWLWLTSWLIYLVDFAVVILSVCSAWLGRGFLLSAVTYKLLFNTLSDSIKKTDLMFVVQRPFVWRDFQLEFVLDFPNVIKKVECRSHLLHITVYSGMAVLFLTHGCHVMIRWIQCMHIVCIFHVGAMYVFISTIFIYVNYVGAFCCLILKGWIGK